MDNWPGLKLKLSKTQRKQQAENAQRRFNTLQTPPNFARLSVTPTWTTPVTGGQSHSGSGWSGRGQQGMQWDKPSLKPDNSSWLSFSALASNESTHSIPFGGSDKNKIKEQGREVSPCKDQIDEYLYSGAPDTVGDVRAGTFEPTRQHSLSEDQIEKYLYSDAPDATEKLHAISSGAPIHETLNKDEVDDYLYSDGPDVVKATTQPVTHQVKQPQIAKKAAPTAEPGKSGVPDGQDFFCYVCNIHCHNPKYYKKHMEGARHKRNLDAQRAATTKFYQYFCKLCDVNCQSETCYDLHSKSKKHLANVAEQEMKRKDAENRRNTYHCHLCDVDCSDYMGYRQHLQDKNHKSQEQVYNARFPPDLYSCSLCNVKCHTPVAFHYHVINVDHKKKEEASGMPHIISPLAYTCRVCFVECGNKQTSAEAEHAPDLQGYWMDMIMGVKDLKSQEGYTEHSRSEEHTVKNRAQNRATPPPEKKATTKKEKVYLPVNPVAVNDPQVHCDVCDLYCSCAKNYSIHLAGAHHKKKVEEKAIQKLQEQQKDAKAGSKDANDVHVHCEVCNIYCADIQIYKSHLSSVKHRERAVKKSGVKFQKKAQDEVEESGVAISEDPAKNPTLDPKTLFLKGVNLGVKQSELKRLMPKSSAVFIPPEYRKESFTDLCVSCYATFKTEEDAEKAMLFLNGTSFCGQKLVVTYAKKHDLINMVNSLSKGKPGQKRAADSGASETGPTPAKQQALPSTKHAVPSGGINTGPPTMHAVPSGGINTGPPTTHAVPYGGINTGPPTKNAVPSGGINTGPPTMHAVPSGSINTGRDKYHLDKRPQAQQNVPVSFHQAGGLPLGSDLPEHTEMYPYGPPRENVLPGVLGPPNGPFGPPIMTIGGFGVPIIPPGAIGLPNGPPGGFGALNPPAGNMTPQPIYGSPQDPWGTAKWHSIPRVYGPKTIPGPVLLTIHGFTLGRSERKLWKKLADIVQLDMLPDFRSEEYKKRYCVAYAHYATRAAADNVIRSVDKRTFDNHPISIQYTDPEEDMLQMTRDGPNEEEKDKKHLWIYGHIFQTNVEQLQKELLPEASHMDVPPSLAFKPAYSRDYEYVFAIFSDEGKAAAALTRLTGSKFNGAPIRAGYCFKFFPVKKVKKGKRRR